MTKQILSTLKIVALALVLSLGLSYAYAWTAPASLPPAGNVSAPLNTSATAQTKAGVLTVAGLTSTQDINLGANKIIAGGSNSLYGAFTVQGEKNTWSGIQFKNAAGASAGTLMMHPSYSGFYNGADNNWRMYVTDGAPGWGNVYANDYYSAASGRWVSQLSSGPSVYSCPTDPPGCAKLCAGQLSLLSTCTAGYSYKIDLWNSACATRTDSCTLVGKLVP